MVIANAKMLGHPSTWPENYRYCGRKMPRQGLKGSDLANPYPIMPGVTRDESVQMFHEDLFTAVKRCLTSDFPTEWQRRMCNALRALKEGDVLVCWCRDELNGAKSEGQKCHCQSIRQIWLWAEKYYPPQVSEKQEGEFS